MTDIQSTEVRYRYNSNYPGYRVGDDGSVWSRHNNRYGLGQVWRRLKPIRFGKTNHRMVSLRNGDKITQFQIHRLVLEAFVGPCPEGMECCHNDGDPTNNRLDNLRWDTRQANVEDSIKHGTKPKGERCSYAKLTAQQVGEIRQRLKEGETQARIAKEFMVSQALVSFVNSGKRWNRDDRQVAG